MRLKISVCIILCMLTTVFFAAAQKKRIDTLRLVLIKAKTDMARCRALLDLSNAYTAPNPDSAIIFGQQAYLVAKKSNWALGQAKSLNNMAGAYESLGDYVKGIQFYIKVLKIAGELNDLYMMSVANGNIGATYIQQQDYKKALPYLHMAQKLLSTFALSHKFLIKHKYHRAVIYLNTGECYMDLRQADSAAYYLNMSYDESKELKFTDLIGTVQRDLGEVEVEKGNKAGALQFFRQAVINNKAVDDRQDVSIACLSTANLYHKYRQQDSAEYYAQKALEAAEDGKYEQDVLNAGKVLYTLYDEDHNLPQAYKYFKITTAAKDSLYSQDKVKRLLSIDFDEKQRLQELQVAQKEARAEAENRLRTYILSGGLGVLLLLAVIFWRNNWQNKRAKTQIQYTLDELKATQTQLIQSAKMASLGELTAGIAHEIQNPLNFVNNFSDVNREMIDELREELKGGNVEEAIAIIDDIQQNEEKINHHGKRADAIVKGMLQHSKSGSGVKEPVNINALADEYLRLSYHGIRAKDKSFNAELVTHFDTALPKVNAIPQDIGRVILNLFNNAFYAVNQKQKTAGADYKPEVSVTTSTTNGQVVIRVKDNGTGIPDAVKEKIMQPFFTTKPTGEGTGLGLSLTYDMVVKGHGGSISVNTKEGKFTEFVVMLPA